MHSICTKSTLYIVFFILIDEILVSDAKVRIDANHNQIKGALRPAVEAVNVVTPTLPQGPHFDLDAPSTVAAAVGTLAHIPCKARNLGSKSVSWIRERDLQVLTVGSFTFTNDERFSAHRDPHSGDWVLVLRRPLPSDSGDYVCSISTKPAVTHSLKLKVVVPSAEMTSDGEVYLDRGSTLNLTCVVHFSPSPPEFILWYHREKLVNYGNRGRKITVQTLHVDDTTWSSLLVYNATLRDSGIYACKASNADRVTARVHVIKSEKPAAMQTTTSGSVTSGVGFPACLLVLAALVGTSVLSSDAMSRAMR